MRLAYLVSRYPTLTHTFVLAEIRALLDLGHQVEVVAIRPADRPAAQLSPLEQEESARTWVVFRAGVLRVVAAQLGAMVTRPAKYFRGLWSALALSQFDLGAVVFNVAYFGQAVVVGWRLHRLGITHVHTHFSSTVALFLSRVFPITFSITIHGPDEFNDAVGFYLAEKVAEAEFIVATTQFARSQLMRASESRHWHKLEVLPQGIDTAAFSPRPRAQPPAWVEIVTVGRLARVKGHAILIEAIGQLVEAGRTGIRMRIIGGGPEHDGLAQLISARTLDGHVILEGPCGQDRVRLLCGAADLFVLASFAEGIPTVLMEAMAMEVPCIATWVSGVPELIRHDVDGWLVPPSDPAALATAVAYLIDYPEVRRRLGKAGRVRVQDGFAMAKNARRLADIFAREVRSSL